MGLREWSVDEVVSRQNKMSLSISEILQRADTIEKKEEKIAWLREHDSLGLRAVLMACFNPNIKWLLPAGDPTYKPAEFLDLQGRLYNETTHFNLFIEGGHPTLTQKRREQLFLQVLESVTPTDAKLLLSIKDKKMPYKSVTEKLVHEAFPDIGQQ